MYGTNVLMNILSEAGGLPTHNFAAGIVRVRGRHRRRDAARDDRRARRPVEPRVLHRLRHPVLALLDGQGRPLQDQGSGVRDRLVVRCGLRHQGPRRDRRARPRVRRPGPGHHRDGRARWPSTWTPVRSRSAMRPRRSWRSRTGSRTTCCGTAPRRPARSSASRACRSSSTRRCPPTTRGRSRASA